MRTTNRKGETRTMLCGMRATVIEYSETSEIAKAKASEAECLIIRRQGMRNMHYTI